MWSVFVVSSVLDSAFRQLVRLRILLMALEDCLLYGVFICVYPLTGYLLSKRYSTVIRIIILNLRIRTASMELIVKQPLLTSC